MPRQARESVRAFFEKKLNDAAGARARSTKQKAHIQRYENLCESKGIASRRQKLSWLLSRMGKTTIELANTLKEMNACFDK